jgi:hypothetical protein
VLGTTGLGTTVLGTTGLGTTVLDKTGLGTTVPAVSRPLAGRRRDPRLRRQSVIAKASISTSISSRGRPVITVVRLGKTPEVQCCATKAP